MLEFNQILVTSGFFIKKGGCKMKKFMNWLKSEESGQGMVEYALIIALVAVALIAGLVLLRGGINNVFKDVNDNLS